MIKWIFGLLSSEKKVTRYIGEGIAFVCISLMMLLSVAIRGVFIMANGATKQSLRLMKKDTMTLRFQTLDPISGETANGGMEVYTLPVGLLGKQSRTSEV